MGVVLSEDIVGAIADNQVAITYQDKADIVVGSDKDPVLGDPSELRVAVGRRSVKDWWSQECL